MRRGKLSGKIGGAVMLAGLFGCEVPTELPKWNTTWVLPGENSTISVGSLLPGEVSVVAGGSEFQLSLAAITFSRSIGELCGPCAPLNGATVPKPEFTAQFDSNVSLPSNVVSVDLTGGRIGVRLLHDFSFDPLRPSATGRGFLVITALRGETVLAKDSINGQSTALPANTPMTRTLTLGSAAVAGPITVRIRLHSPAGDPVVIDTSDRLTVTATPAEIRLGAAQVRVANKTVSSSEEELALEDLDEEISSRVKGGALRLQIDNPFSVTGSIGLRISAPGIATIVKSIEIVSGAASQRVEFTEAEIRSILGKPGVRLTLSGAVTSPIGGTTVRPSDAIGIRSQLELTIGPKED